MSKRFTLITLVLSSVIAFLVGVIIAGGVTRTPVVSTEPASRPASDKPRATSSANSSVVNFADVAERINAAVVNIEAASRTPVGRFSSRTLRNDDPQPESPRDLRGRDRAAASSSIAPATFSRTITSSRERTESR